MNQENSAKSRPNFRKTVRSFKSVKPNRVTSEMTTAAREAVRRSLKRTKQTLLGSR